MSADDIERIRERWELIGTFVGDTPPALYIGASSDISQLLAAIADRDERIAKLEAELAPHRQEAIDDANWAAHCRQADVRCLDCDLRYGEREQYRCEHGVKGRHTFNIGELRAALGSNEEKQ